MIDREPPVQGSDFKDCKTGLLVFGILQVVLGALLALMVPFLFLMMFAFSHLDESAAAPMSTDMVIFSALFYVVLAVWFIWVGFGSIHTRRWARSLVLVTSWIWLVVGIQTCVFMLLFMPDMYDRMAQEGKVPSGMVTYMKFTMFVTMAVMYVIIPGSLVLFYGRKNVKATCEFRDPKVRWTDKCPLPVLAVSLMCGLWATSMVLMGFNGWAIPFFGRILSGATGAGVTLVVTLLLGCAAWRTYKLDMKGWWCAVLLTIGWGISTGITFSSVSVWDYYEKMNYTEQQLETMKQYMPTATAMGLILGVWVVGILGYLLYTRRYFMSPSSQGDVS